MIDVAIIGGGVIGAAIARQLSRYRLSLVLIEKDTDVGGGASKANTGIIHVGYDPLPGSLKARLNVEGSSLMEMVAAELDVPFRRIGSLAVATDPSQLPALEELLERGRCNGVPGLSIVSGEALRGLEPRLTTRALAALYAPSTGVICPHRLTIALVENSAANGVSFRLGEEVISLMRRNGAWEVGTPKGKLRAQWVVNCAGVHSDEVAALSGAAAFQVRARKGQYLILDRPQQALVSRVIFPVPSAVSKGVLITPTFDGTVLLGPTAEEVPDKGDVSTTAAGLDTVWAETAQLIPDLDRRDIIGAFAGLRAAGSTGDFIIEAPCQAPGLVNVAGIDSPGLTASPAIASYVAELLAEGGLKLQARRDYHPERKGIGRFASLSPQAQDRLIAADPRYGRIICRCETVTEGEIVESIHRPLGARTIDAVRRRTRAGMGRCQSASCHIKIAFILARELGASPLDILGREYEVFSSVGGERRDGQL